MTSWKDSLTVDDLPNEDLKIVADILGLNTAVDLMEELPGIVINVPKLGFNKYRNQYICKQYDGSKLSRTDLAFKFGVTEGYISQLICRNRKKAS